MSSAKLWKTKFSKIPKFLLTLVLIAGWIFSGWPQIDQVYALNKTANFNFNGNSTGWTATNGSGTTDGTGSPACGTNVTTTQTNMATFAYNGVLSGQTAFEATSGAVKGTWYAGNINQTFVAPGSGTVQVKGKMSYYGNSTAWGTGKVSLEIWNSANTTFIGTLGCVVMTANTAWTTTAFSANVALTGGTTYTIRGSFVVKTKTNSNTAVTLGADNLVVNVAPVGLVATAPAATTNAQLNWTTSTAGSGANGLHATTPYKIYRNAASPVSTFLANSTTNSYTDSSTVGNTTYFYAVSDLDTVSDESPLSAESSILTLPGAPTALNFTGVTDVALRVNWTAPTGGATSYKVERCAGSGCTGFTQIAAGVTTAFYDDSSLTCNTLYRYQVRATNATGDGAYSAIAQQLTNACAPSQTLTFSLGASSLAIPSAGNLSSTAVSSNSHTITVGTNATNGVAVTYSGATLTSGANTILAMSTAAASSVGTEQFGINAKLNTTPAVGAECSGTAPIAAAATGYDVVDNFKFVSGETVVSFAGPINDTTCTISYIANIAAATEAGSYSATLTYVATATF